MSDWRDINDGPRRDGQPCILALDQGRYGDIRRAPVIAYWDDNIEQWCHWSHRDTLSATPTHWMPLPAPPLDKTT